jgi:glycosyltransferase involved in cell wall biosynthesis
MQELRIAWLLPVTWFYWQPFLSKFTSIFPKTKIYTGLFPGYANGLEHTLDIELVGRFQVIEYHRDQWGYSDSFTYLSPKVIIHLLKFKPQVIFSSSFGIWTIFALLLKPLLRAKVIIAYEGSSPVVDYRHSPLRLFIRRIMVRTADACITNSQAGKHYLIDVLKAQVKQVFAHPYEIPDISTLPESETIKVDECLNKSPVFLFVGHIIPRKGLSVLLEACLMLQIRGYEGYSLMIVGSGPQQEELQSFCREHNLLDCVNWIGRVSYERISSYFKLADVFIFPTLEDTWGVVALEAMLMGKPILCSKGAGTAELVMHGENGYIFSPGNAMELASLMQKIIDCPDSISKMGQESQSIMVSYTPETAAQYLAQAVTTVVDGEAF